MPPQSPDNCAKSFLGYTPDPERYNTENELPLESTATIENLVPENSTVLDVGCGVGAIAARIASRKKAKVTAIEPDQRRAEIARLRKVDVHECYLDEQTLNSFGTYDVVLFADVLEHTPDPGKILHLSSQLLSPNGMLLISVPNIAHWSVRLNLLFGRFDYDQYGIMDATHLRWFTRKSLSSFLTNCGFSIRSIHFTAGATLPVYERMRWFPRRIRTKIVRILSQRLPSLFACQFVVVATLASPHSNSHLAEVK